MVKVAENRQKTDMFVAGSTLVEVLVALLILLTVFGMGMLIFARLMQSSDSHLQQQVQGRLRQLQEQYQNGGWDPAQNVIIEHMEYALELREMKAYADRQKVTIYAYDNRIQQVIDSVTFVMPLQDEE